MGVNALQTLIDLIIKEVHHLGTSLTFPALVPYHIALLSTLIPSNIAMLAKS